MTNVFQEGYMITEKEVGKIEDLFVKEETAVVQEVNKLETEAKAVVEKVETVVESAVEKVKEGLVAAEQVARKEINLVVGTSHIKNPA